MVHDQVSSVTGDKLQQMLHEARQFFHPFPEGRHLDRKRINSVEEVLSELTCEDLFLKVLVRGGNETKIGNPLFNPSERPKPLFFEHFEKLGLDGQVHIADFVKKERTSVGPLEKTLFLHPQRR